MNKNLLDTTSIRLRRTCMSKLSFSISALKRTGMAGRGGAKHARYDTTQVRCFDISKLSVPYPTLVGIPSLFTYLVPVLLHAFAGRLIRSLSFFVVCCIALRGMRLSTPVYTCALCCARQISYIYHSCTICAYIRVWSASFRSVLRRVRYEIAPRYSYSSSSNSNSNSSSAGTRTLWAFPPAIKVAYTDSSHLRLVYLPEGDREQRILAF